MQNWHFIQQQPLLRRIFKDPPIVSYRRGRSLKDILVRAKLYLAITRVWKSCRSVTFIIIICVYCSSVPLCLLFLSSSVPLCLLILCSSVPTVSLFLSAYCSSVPTVPLFLCTYCSSIPLCQLFLCSSVSLHLLFLCSSVPLCLLFFCASVRYLMTSVRSSYTRHEPFQSARHSFEEIVLLDT